VRNDIKFILGRHPNRLGQVTWNLRDCGSGARERRR